MNITLNIGFVCTAISPYYAEEYKIAIANATNPRNNANIYNYITFYKEKFDLKI